MEFEKGQISADYRDTASQRFQIGQIPCTTRDGYRAAHPRMPDWSRIPKPIYSACPNCARKTVSPAASKPNDSSAPLANPIHSNIECQRWLSTKWSPESSNFAPTKPQSPYKRAGATAKTSGICDARPDCNAGRNQVDETGRPRLWETGPATGEGRKTKVNAISISESQCDSQVQMNSAAMRAKTSRKYLFLMGVCRLADIDVRGNEVHAILFSWSPTPHLPFSTG